MALGTVTTASTVDFQRAHRRHTAVAPVAVIVPATILLPQHRRRCRERCDVWEGLVRPSRPQCKKMGMRSAISRAQCGVRTSSLWCIGVYNNMLLLDLLLYVV